MITMVINIMVIIIIVIILFEGSVAASVAALPPPPTLAIPTRAGGETVMLRIGELKAISDALGRAQTAARQAQRVAAAAATAFAGEANVLADAKATVDKHLP